MNNFNGSNGATFLGYFTVGDVDMYRSMIVFNNRYYDLLRFTPGNPPAPASIQGPVGNTPAALGLVCGATSLHHLHLKSALKPMYSKELAAVQIFQCVKPITEYINLLLWHPVSLSLMYLIKMVVLEATMLLRE
ncbi:MAG: hypothetical protein IPL08_14500 [Saprospiraceae bacterium]|nr:hypothetical protein [Saprospiraceae bacterium]